MRIALITDHPPYTGIGKYSFELYKHMQDIMVGNLDLVFVRWSTRDWHPENVAVTKVITMTRIWPIRSVSYLRTKFYTPIARNYSVYHSTHPMLAEASPCPERTVVTVHDLLPLAMPSNYPFFYNLLFRSSINKVRGCRKIIAGSHSTKKDLLVTARIPEEKIRVIYYGVDDHFAPGPSCRRYLNIPQNKKIVLHVGSEERRKNVTFLLKVLSGVSKHFSDLVLVRIGDRRPYTQDLIKKLSLEQRVMYVTGVQRNLLPSYYRSADLFLFPSIYEGFGLPLLEAMASGCPVIAASTSSLPEVVGNGGLLLPLDVDEWVAAVSEVLTNESKRREMISAGLRQASKFSWSKAAEETLKVYDEIV